MVWQLVPAMTSPYISVAAITIIHAQFQIVMNIQMLNHDHGCNYNK